jgi:glycosyltransferase involved in cell wall biosynthesis
MRRLTVLVNAGPWLPVPPAGYGGIENVLATLIPELRTRGHRVVLATVGESEIEVDRQVSLFDQGQFDRLAEPYNRVVGVVHAHMQMVLDELCADREIDLVHDHVEVAGASALARIDAAPPVLQTLHWDLRKHAEFYSTFDGRGRVFFNGVSARQLELAPPALRRQALGAVPLATCVEKMPYESRKGDHFALVGRLTPEKGADIAARICREHGLELRLAGPVAAARDAEEVEARLAEPEGGWPQLRDARFYLERVRPFEGASVRWLGSLEREANLRLIASARAVLFPLRWDEPGATAAIEALACGTPVIGLRRGALCNIVEHGVTGFLADDVDQLARYMKRARELRPEACRAAAEERFDAALMAERYVQLYEEVLERAGAQTVKTAWSTSRSRAAS